MRNVRYQPKNDLIVAVVKPEELQICEGIGWSSLMECIPLCGPGSRSPKPPLPGTCDVTLWPSCHAGLEIAFNPDFLATVRKAGQLCLPGLALAKVLSKLLCRRQRTGSYGFGNKGIVIVRLRVCDEPLAVVCFHTSSSLFTLSVRQVSECAKESNGT